jgi:hypothetical protein
MYNAEVVIHYMMWMHITELSEETQRTVSQ